MERGMEEKEMGTQVLSGDRNERMKENACTRKAGKTHAWRNKSFS